MEGYQFQFEKLKVWQASRRLVAKVYALVKGFPKYEQYALADQLRRAAISVPSNIAEGNSRYSVKEQIHFFEIAFASLMEVYCQLQIAVDLGYIQEDELQGLKSEIYAISRMVSSLRQSKKVQLEQ